MKSAGTKTCQECGTAYAAAKRDQRYCSPACRKSGNNRRMTRGAELYDFYMSMRFERATHSGNIAVMNQMAAAWREDDKVNRAGRYSWATPDLNADPRAFEIARENIRNSENGNA